MFFFGGCIYFLELFSEYHFLEVSNMLILGFVSGNVTNSLWRGIFFLLGIILFWGLLYVLLLLLLLLLILHLLLLQPTYALRLLWMRSGSQVWSLRAHVQLHAGTWGYQPVSDTTTETKRQTAHPCEAQAPPAPPNRAALVVGPATQPRLASLPTMPEAPSQTQEQQDLRKVLREAGCGPYAPIMMAQGATLPMLATLEIRDYIAIFRMQLCK